MIKALVLLKEFRPSITVKAIAREIWIDDEALRQRIEKRRLNLNDNQKKIIQEHLDCKIRELIKIKRLVDKDIQWCS